MVILMLSEAAARSYASLTPVQPTVGKSTIISFYNNLHFTVLVLSISNIFLMMSHFCKTLFVRGISKVTHSL